MENLLDTATSTFQETTGYSLGSFLTWTIDYLLRPAVGSIFATLDAYKYWIVMVVFVALCLAIGLKVLTMNRH